MRSRKAYYPLPVAEPDDVDTTAQGPTQAQQLRRLRLAVEFLITAGFLNREKLKEAEDFVEKFHPTC